MARRRRRSMFTEPARRRRGVPFWLRLALAAALVGWFAYSGVEVARGERVAMFAPGLTTPMSPTGLPWAAGVKARFEE